MLYDYTKDIVWAGTKDIWFVTTEGNLYFGKRDFNKTAARRWIANTGEEFTSDKIFAYGYQSEVIPKESESDKFKKFLNACKEFQIEIPER